MGMQADVRKYHESPSDSGASGAFTVEGPFTIAHDTANIGTAAGVALWTPSVGDIVVGFDVRITTPFDAGFLLQLGSYGVDGAGELLDQAQIMAGADGVDYSQSMGTWHTCLTAATVRARTNDGNDPAVSTAGALTLRAYVIAAP